MAQPAKNQRLEHVGSTEFSLPFNTARFAGQHIRSFFQDVLQRLLDVCYICHVCAPSALDIRFLFLTSSQMEHLFASAFLKLVRMGGFCITPHTHQLKNCWVYRSQE